MIGLDTNVLVRYFTQDDEAQAKLSKELIRRYAGKAESLFINNIVICELIWVLERGYKYSRQQISSAIKLMLSAKEFAYENLEHIWLALNEYELNGVDFSDALIGEINKLQGCQATYTFDQKALKLGSFESIVCS
ncbi:MAG: type II toxin-antitoxin system VapC family toxin [Candidatus Jidaibacter sp.]|nr:type II toxin-antitoxin system VapC family toxin [Candidatus Jidaibacter sp.]